jgi:hypothetical protein
MNPMAECPRYDRCNAPICPLDPDWRLRSHLAGERVCRWLTELAKPGGERELECHLQPDLVERVVQISPAILSHHALIQGSVRRASGTGSKLEHHRQLGRLHKERHGAESPRHAPESIGRRGRPTRSPASPVKTDFRARVASTARSFTSLFAVEQ